MSKDAIKNWKLQEVFDQIEIIADNSVDYRNDLLEKLQLPLTPKLTGLDRSETTINWQKMPEYYRFFLDGMGMEEKIKEAFAQSELGKRKHLIMLTHMDVPAVKLPVTLFLDDWEGFLAATYWEGFIFSEDFKLIIEATRDYYLHSNFYIM